MTTYTDLDLATETKQDAIITAVNAKSGTQEVSGAVAVSNLPATQPVSATSLPLPTGAATSASQSTGNTSLASIDTKLPTLLAGADNVDGTASGTANKLVTINHPRMLSGSNWVRQTGDASNGLDVDVTRVQGNVAVTGPLTSAEHVAALATQTAALVALPVNAASVVSSTNSTTSSLASNAVFTGTSESVKDYAVSVITVFADVASAVNGLAVQFSMDAGVSWRTSDTYTIPANTLVTFSIQPVWALMRVVYTNGAAAQGLFQMQVTHHFTATKASSQRPIDAQTNEVDLEQVMGYNVLYNPRTDQWDRQRTPYVTTSGTITTQNLVPAGTATVNSAVELALFGASGVMVQVTGTYSGILTAQGTVDGTTWVTLSGNFLLQSSAGGYATTIASAATGLYHINTSGLTRMRITGLAAMTGTATVTLSGVTTPGTMAIGAPIPAGANTIGTTNTNLNAGTTRIGYLNQAVFAINVASTGLTVATTTYTSGDQLGAEMTFAGASVAAGLGGIVVSATLIDKSKILTTGDVELWLFTAPSTPAGDNLPADWTDTNILNFRGMITFPTAGWKVNPSNALNVQQNLAVGYQCASTGLYGVLVTRQANAVFTAASDLQVNLTVSRD